MKNKDVLVSAELAKEKLARIPEMWVHSKTCDPTGAPCTHQIMGAEVAQLIRNTDLTDCQQGKLLTRPAQVGGTVFAVGVREDMVVRRAERQYEYEHEKAKSDE